MDHFYLSDPFRAQRKNTLRLENTDYSLPRGYYVTINQQNRLPLFGNITHGLMALNAAGIMLASTWAEFPNRYPGCKIDEFIVMPDHFHALVWVNMNTVGETIEVGGRPRSRGEAGLAPAINGSRILSLSDILHRFKSYTTTMYRLGVTKHGWQPFNGRLWQRGFYDRVVRDHDDLSRIRQYIQKNPERYHIKRQHT